MSTKQQIKTLALVLSLVSSAAFADTISLGLMGVSAHAVGVDDAQWSTMPNKISKTGYVVWNPEINLTYERKGWLVNATYAVDCQGRNSYYVGAGYRWDVNPTFHVAAMAGAFFRTHALYDSKTGKAVRTNKQVLFVPWVTLEKDFPITNSLSAFASVSSNYALTHAVMGLKVSF